MTVMPSRHTSGIAVPAAFHEVLGERTRRGDLVLIGIAGAAIAGACAGFVDFGAVAAWRAVVAVLLVADIASGAVANLSPGTNEFYANRPAHRWVFIAVHVHVLALAWLMDAPMAEAVRVWLLAVGGAVVVNLAAGSALQRPLGGLVLTSTLALVPMVASTSPAPLLGVYLLFVLKVVYSFAVDHDGEAGARPVLADGIHPMQARMREAAVDVLVAAFERDPLMVELGPPTVRETLVRALLRLNRVMGGRPRVLVVDGRVVGAYLLEPALAPWSRRCRSVASAIVGLLWLMPVGPRRGRVLNDYMRVARAAMPSAAHHYLTMIGVDPGEHGRGHARTMMAHIEAQVAASPRSVGLGLDTENPRNHALYLHLGFEKLGSHALSPHVTVTSFFKKPQRERPEPEVSSLP